MHDYEGSRLRKGLEKGTGVNCNDSRPLLAPFWPRKGRRRWRDPCSAYTVIRKNKIAMTTRHAPPSVISLFQALAARSKVSIGQPARTGSFDQLVQVANARDVNIRFVRDRGDEFLEIGEGNEWFSVDLVRLVLLGGDPKDIAPQLDEDISFLTQHFDVIEQIFDTSNRQLTLQKLRDIRTRKIRCMFPDDAWTEKRPND
jgi:hypothetical protein